MTFPALVALFGIPPLFVSVIAPQRNLALAAALLSLSAIAGVTGLLYFGPFTCGGEICLENFIVSMILGLAALLGDLILLVRWFVHRHFRSEP